MYKTQTEKLRSDLGLTWDEIRELPENELQARIDELEEEKLER